MWSIVFEPYHLITLSFLLSLFQFGPGEIQQHGFARNVNWEVKSQTETTVELEMLPSDYTKEMWDKEFACRFTVDLADDELKTNMKVDNTGSADSFDFQAALHSYFAVSSLENLEIAGSFEGKEFLNKMVGENGEMQTESRSAITITEEYDRGKIFFNWEMIRLWTLELNRMEWNHINSESDLELLF